MDIDLVPNPTVVQLHRIEYVCRSRARDCRTPATTITRKLDKAGRFIRHIQLCDSHAEFVAERERERGLEVEHRRLGNKVRHGAKWNSTVLRRQLIVLPSEGRAPLNRLRIDNLSAAVEKISDIDKEC